MLSWCTRKVPSSHHHHHPDAYAEPGRRREAYVPSREAARRRMEGPGRDPPLPDAPYQVGRQGQMSPPPPPPPKDDHLTRRGPTAKSSGGANKPPKLDYKRYSTASTWGRNLVAKFQPEVPVPQMGEIPIRYQPKPDFFNGDAEERKGHRRCSRQDKVQRLEKASVFKPIAVVGPNTRVRPKIIDIPSQKGSRSPRKVQVFKHQQE